MDVNDLRSAVTVLGLLLFVALMAWTWRPRARHDHDAAARLPFDGEVRDNNHEGERP
ncbi:MAG TPA: cbb3-type cytochrome c oxidase subunit 3 [Burkholderiaceae bacterium]